MAVRFIRFRSALAAALAAVLFFEPAAPALAREQADIPGKVRKAATVNFRELARQEALAPARPPRRKNVPPFMPGPGGPSEPSAVPAPSAPPAPSGPSGVPSPSPVTNFEALGDNNTSIPPDTHGTVGPDHVMTTLNTQYRIQSKTGSNLLTVSIDNFWTQRGISGNPDVFDPKVLYDPYGQRWLLVACANGNSATSTFFFGASETNDPTGNWNLYQISSANDGIVNGSEWIDYPSVGFNKDWFAVNMNIFDINGGGSKRSQTWIFDKADLYAGAAVDLQRFDHASSDFTLVPAITYDSTLATLYLVEQRYSSPGTIRLYSITGTIPTATLTTIASPTAGITWEETPATDNFAEQLGSSVKIHNGDHRMQAVVYRNSRIWAVHHIFLPAGTPTRTAVQWWELNTAGTVIQRAVIDDATGAGCGGFRCYYAYPSLSVNKDNDVLIGYSRFAKSQYPSANYSFRFGGDAANTLRDDTVLKAGVDFYDKDFGGSKVRWGDYSATSVDPANDSSFWTLQEYAEDRIVDGDSDTEDARFGTWWGHIIPADLSVTLTADKSKVGIGQTITFTAPVSNVGGKTFTGVTLTDALPSGLAFRSASSTAGSCTESGGTVTCAVGTLAAGASATVTIAARGATAGSVTNTVSIAANEADGNSSNNSASVTAQVNPVSAVYPNPWRPGATGDFASAAGPCGAGIVFEAPADSTVRIYNTQGDLIRDYTITSADATAPSDPTKNCKAWDGKNDSGTVIASGIYLAVVKPPTGSEEIRKIAIEK